MDIEFAASDASVVYAITRQYHLYKSIDGGAGFAFVEDLRTNVIP